jgi:hypothetical protein
MIKSQLYLVTAVVGIFSACSSEPSIPEATKHDIPKSESSNLEEVETPDFEIINETELKVDFLLRADGMEFDSPEGTYYYFIGDYPISFVEGKKSFFILQRWNLVLKSDTILFEKRPDNLKDKGVNPVASINAQYNKYEVGRVHNSKLGKANLSENGYSCDDSFSGQFDLVKNDKTLTIKGLANIDLFENQDGTELYILSYHNCLGPDLRIYRISE